VKERMDDMLRIVEEAGSDGIEMRELVKIYYEKWGFRLATIKGYVSDLEELEKVRVVGTMIYHFSYQPPIGLVRSTR
jgi:sugar phosphate isomerase/epimerase